ncbi:MAG TPA: PAS domain S-box protein, partial [Chitinophagaceae bacterium]|nr:PAS domain S-box protein [Chitinophagaceae bacterium]
LRRSEFGFFSLFTTRYEGSRTARFLIPFAVIIPITTGLLRLYGEQIGLYSSGMGVALFAVTNIILFLFVIWRAVLSINTSSQALEAEMEERKKAEQILHDNQQLLQSIIDNASSFIYVKDLDGKYMMVNNAYTKMFGISKKDMMGKTAFDLTSYESALKLKQEDEQLIKGNKIFESEQQVPLGGNMHDFFSVRFPLTNSDGKIYATGAVFTDITEIKKQSNQIKDLYDNAPSGYYSLDVNGIFVNANSTTLKWLGYKKEELMGKHLTDILAPESRNVFTETFPVFKQKGYVKDLELLYTRKDGTTFPVLINASAVKNESGDFLYSRSTIMDITERKKLETRETALRKEIELLLSSTGEGLYGIDQERKCTFINKAGASMLGYKPEECIGKDMHQLVHYKKRNGDVYPPSECPIVISITNKKSSVINTDVFWKADGSFFDVQYSSYPVIDNNELKGGVVTFSDITESKKLEEALNTSNEKFLKLFYSSPLAMVIRNIEDGKILDLNEEYESLTGYKKEEVVGTTTVGSGILLNHDTGDDVKRMVTEKKALKNIEATIHNKKKEAINIIVSMERICLDNKECILTGILDITERKKLEEDLWKSEQQFRQIVETAQEGIWTIDENNKTNFANKKMADILEYTVEEMLGKTLFEFMDEEGIALALEILERQKYKPKERNEFKYITKSGRQIWADIATNSIFGQDKVYQGAIAMVTDISDRKKTEEQIKELNNELESFTYSVSHDLRAPLRIINGYAEMVKQEARELSEEPRRMLDNIILNASQMGRLIDDLLNFSRMGRKDLVTHNTNMSAVVQSILEQLPKGMANYTIHVNNLPECYCDSSLIKQVWENLISNAVKYSSNHPHPVIEIGSIKESHSNVYYIKDNGAGFDMKYYDKLFGVFQRLHKASEFEGTGVGLALSQRIISKHGGKIWAESKINEGSTFYFTVCKS